MYYIGFLKKDARHAMVFKSIKKPKQDDLTYFLHVMGPYVTERLARSRVNLIKRYGYRENPVREKIKNVVKEHYVMKWGKGRKKNVITPEKALRLTRKVIAYAKDLHKDYKENPGQSYHDKKFLLYIGELEKYKVGSEPYIATLAKAYEHLESAKESMKEGVR